MSPSLRPDDCPFCRKISEGSVTYKNRNKALDAAAHLSHLGPQRAYRCPYCGKYHLTSKRALS